MSDSFYYEYYAEDEAKAIAIRDLIRLLYQLKIGYTYVYGHVNWAGDITIQVQYKD